MVEEIVNNIIEAEDRAAEIVKNAREEAKAIVSEAQKNSENRRAAFVKESRAAMVEKERQAAEKGRAAYDALLQSGREEAATLGEKYRENMESTAETVVAAITD